MISVGIDGIDIGEADFDVTPNIYNYARLVNAIEPTVWFFNVKDNVDSVAFKIEWEDEFKRFILTRSDIGLELYIRLNDQWANILRTIPRFTKWVSDEPMAMLAYPDGRVIPIKPLRDAVRADVLANLQSFIDSDGIYPDCDSCMENW
ncbi:MAG: hypothetical protein WC248_04950 [Candidatus Methanomethylophilaceae archaeon]|jgi:hypothetical protein